MLISFVSLQGSPGVSAAALAFGWTWPRHAVVAECDPTGGRALTVFDPDGAHGRRGTFELLVMARRMPLHRAMSAQMLTLPDGTGTHHVLPGAGSMREAGSLQWQGLAGLFQSLETVDVLADCGRLRLQGTPRAVLAAADLTVLVVRNDRNSLRTAAESLDIVRNEVSAFGQDNDGIVILLAAANSAADKGFPVPEIAKEFAARSVPVVGALPWDPQAAACFTDVHLPGRRFETSPLLTSARRLGGELGHRAQDRVQRLRTAPHRDAPESRPPRSAGASVHQLHLVRAPESPPVPRATPNKEG